MGTSGKVHQQGKKVTRTQASVTYNQPGQSVDTQFNIARDARITINPSSPEALAQIPAKLAGLKGARRDELRALENEFGRTQELARHYVIPDLQDFSPPDQVHSPGLIASREPAFKSVDGFLRRPLDENGNRCLFVLGDAGMGKTSLLVMLKFRHLTGSLPGARYCTLMKLGSDTLDRIDAGPHPAQTLLLLDSLDEDPEAHDPSAGADKRLLDLLPRVVRFQRTVITCRMQFFPEMSRHLTTLPGHFVIGAYECPLKYLSLFNEEQVEEYLARRFRPNRRRRLYQALTGRVFGNQKLDEARRAAGAMESLRMRPLLLSYIEDFVSSDDRPCVDFGNRYNLYHRLVDQWLRRDAVKHLGMKPDEGWRVAVLLALHMVRQGPKQIHRDELTCAEGLEQIPRFKIEARSLISRTEDFRYQFAHTTIQEFLLAHAVLNRPFDVRNIPLSREAFRFLLDGQKLMGKETLDLRGARMDFAEAGMELVRLKWGMDLVPIPAGTFLMGSPEDEGGRFSDETQHEVRLTGSFWLARYTVTQAQYQRVMGQNPSHVKGEHRPVENVSWEDALAFCRRLTARASEAGALAGDYVFRLPSEAEWEYACRAGTTSAFNDGSDCTRPTGQDPALDPLGWYDKNSGNETHAVGQKAPNAWGLHDMHGNVWEWCLDQCDWENRVVTDTYEGGAVDPLCTRGAGHVVRGGSFLNFARDCRSAYRHGLEPGSRPGPLGFRLAAGRPEAGGARGTRAGGAERRDEARGPAGRPDAEREEGD